MVTRPLLLGAPRVRPDGRGLWPRSVANVLYYTWIIRRVRGVASPPLPSMAQYLMGRSDEPGTHRRRRNLGAQRRAKGPHIVMSPLPQLDALVSRLPGTLPRQNVRSIS